MQVRLKADELAGQAAESVAPWHFEHVHRFVLARAWKLNEWLLPRALYWLKATKPFLHKTGHRTSGLTKAEACDQAVQTKMGGHEWKKGPKGLKCAVCHATAPLYKSLSEFFLVKEACPLPVYISLTRWDPAESVSVSFVVVDTVLGLA